MQLRTSRLISLVTTIVFFLSIFSSNPTTAYQASISSTPGGLFENGWYSVTYGTVSGVGVFVAVANSGTGNRVMTSPDGITWTIRTSAADISWSSVTYGNGLFVAVASSSIVAGDRVMTSPDGITWTIRRASHPDGADHDHVVHLCHEW